MNRSGEDDGLWLSWIASAGLLVTAVVVCLPLPSEPDWPAWVQAIGSIVAILAAIWIDRGSARRAEARASEERLALLADWERCLSEVAQLAQNAARIANNDLQTDRSKALRLIANAVLMIDTYLRHPPPSPRLAIALAAARSHLEIPLEVKAAIDAWEEGNRGSAFEFAPRFLAGDIPKVLATCSKDLTTLVEEYSAGAW